MSAASLLFAFGAFCVNNVAFYVVSLIARSLQGAADAFVLVAVPSIIAVEWPEKNEVYQGYAGISMGIGLMLGPVIATGVVHWVDYFWTLVFFAVLVFVLTMSAICFIPKRIDLNKEEQKEMEDVPWGHFFASPRVVTALIVDFIAAINLIFMDPILVLWLEYLGVNEDNAGLGFALMACTFTIGSGLSGEISQKVDRRAVIGFAIFFTGIALWLAGGLRSESEATTWVGLGLNGLFVAGIFIPMIPEIIGSTEAQIASTRIAESSTNLLVKSVDEISEKEFRSTHKSSMDKVNRSTFKSDDPDETFLTADDSRENDIPNTESLL